MYKIIVLLILISIGIANAEQYNTIELLRFHHFLETDLTDKNTLINDSYTCLGFSMDLINNASLAGWDLKLVNIPPCKTIPSGHFCAAIQKDSGAWIIIEPQTDELLNPLIESKQLHTNITIIDPRGFKKTDSQNGYFKRSAGLGVIRA